MKKALLASLVIVSALAALHAAPQDITITVTDAQVMALRERWPNASQIGLPEGVPTAKQLVQAYFDYGLAGDVARIKTAKVADRTQKLDATKCAAVAKELGVEVADLPCGGGQ